MMEFLIRACSSETQMCDVYIPRLIDAGYHIEGIEMYENHKITIYGLDALVDITDIVENEIIISRDAKEIEIYDYWRE